MPASEVAIILHRGVVLGRKYGPGADGVREVHDNATGESAEVQLIAEREAVPETTVLLDQDRSPVGRISPDAARDLVITARARPSGASDARALGFTQTVRRSRRTTSESPGWLALTMVCAQSIMGQHWRQMLLLSAVLVALAAGFGLHAGGIGLAAAAIPMTMICIAAHEAAHWSCLRRHRPGTGALLQLGSQICIITPPDLPQPQQRLVAASGAAGGLAVVTLPMTVSLLLNAWSLTAACTIWVLMQLYALTPLSGDGRVLWADRSQGTRRHLPASWS